MAPSMPSTNFFDDRFTRLQLYQIVQFLAQSLPLEEIEPKLNIYLRSVLRCALPDDPPAETFPTYQESASLRKEWLEKHQKATDEDILASFALFSDPETPLFDPHLGPLSNILQYPSYFFIDPHRSRGSSSRDWPNPFFYFAILTPKPLLLLVSFFLNPTPSSATYEQRLKDAQKVVDDFHSSEEAWEKKQQQDPSTLFRSFSEHKSKQHASLWVSFFNHSCQPSASIVWDIFFSKSKLRDVMEVYFHYHDKKPIALGTIYSSGYGNGVNEFNVELESLGLDFGTLFKWLVFFPNSGAFLHFKRLGLQAQLKHCVEFHLRWHLDSLRDEYQRPVSHGWLLQLIINSSDVVWFKSNLNFFFDFMQFGLDFDQRKSTSYILDILLFGDGGGRVGEMVAAEICNIQLPVLEYIQSLNPEKFSQFITKRSHFRIISREISTFERSAANLEYDYYWNSLRVIDFVMEMPEYQQKLIDATLETIEVYHQLPPEGSMSWQDKIRFQNCLKNFASGITASLYNKKVDAPTLQFADDDLAHIPNRLEPFDWSHYFHDEIHSLISTECRSTPAYWKRIFKPKIMHVTSLMLEWYESQGKSTHLLNSPHPFPIAFANLPLLHTTYAHVPDTSCIYGWVFRALGENQLQEQMALADTSGSDLMQTVSIVNPLETADSINFKTKLIWQQDDPLQGRGVLLAPLPHLFVILSIDDVDWAITILEAFLNRSEAADAGQKEQSLQFIGQTEQQMGPAGSGFPKPTLPPPVSLNHQLTLHSPSENVPITTPSDPLYPCKALTSLPVRSITPLQFVVCRPYFKAGIRLCAPSPPIFKFQPRVSNGQYILGPEDDDPILELLIDYYVQSLLDGTVDQIHKEFKTEMSC